ncbi:MAG: FecR domain-containing protein [Gemmatimonadaceae bacterium]|nr:FecR domain-containing protein [Gemmatimonadaceae bacterium]
MSDFPPSDGQLARYLAGELPAAERARIDMWVNASPANRATIDQLRGALPSASTGSRWDVDAAWSRASGVINDGSAAAPARMPRVDVPEPRSSSRSARTWYAHPVWRAAAALVMMAGIGYLWRVRENTSRVVETRYSTAVGRARTIVLPDSTVVALGPSSTLRMPAQYGGTTREVELTGEAWFRVTHDATRPFTVRAGNAVTQDIGTEFTVRALPDDSTVRVTVYEGAASVRHRDATVERALLLRAHEVAKVTSSGDVQRLVADSSSTVPWRNGQLTFDQATLVEVAAELRRWYPITVAPLDSALRGRRVSATLPTRDLGESLTILRLALGLTIVQRGDTVDIH